MTGPQGLPAGEEGGQDQGVRASHQVLARIPVKSNTPPQTSSRSPRNYLSVSPLTLDADQARY